MANISDAGGSLTITGEWNTDQLQAFYKVFTAFGTGWYETWLDVDEKEFVDTLMSGYSATFYGNGRWAFMNNLEQFDNWSVYDDAIKDRFGITEAEFNSMRRNLLKEMYKHNLSVDIFYTDYESGTGLLYDATSKISASVEGNFINGQFEHYNFEHETVDVHHYDYDFSNLFDYLLDHGYEDYIANLVVKLLYTYNLFKEHNEPKFRAVWNYIERVKDNTDLNVNYLYIMDDLLTRSQLEKDAPIFLAGLDKVIYDN